MHMILKKVNLWKFDNMAMRKSDNMTPNVLLPYNRNYVFKNLVIWPRWRVTIWPSYLLWQYNHNYAFENLTKWPWKRVTTSYVSWRYSHNYASKNLMIWQWESDDIPFLCFLGNRILLGDITNKRMVMKDKFQYLVLLHVFSFYDVSN